MRKQNAPNLFANNKGQVAIFVALIFQILFLFFAMVINVGLLVHHKINLQNSVDLAVYYGAMKQAEGMNAVAHSNYQIRQSWKLLTWRYRALGSAGEADSEGAAQPFRKIKPGVYASGSDQDSPAGGKFADFYDSPAFCITYVPFRPMPPGENTCRQQATLEPIKLFKSPAHIAGFISFSGVLRSTTEALITQAVARCKIFGPYNYMILGRFVVAYNIDQADRMAVINKVSRALSESTDDFTDIDGESVKDGIKATLEKNLTSANRESLDFQVYNSLGHEACNGTGVSENLPAKWLSKINIVPGFKYVDTDCNRGQIGPVQKELVGGQPIPGTNGPKHYHEDSILKPEVDALSPYIGPRSDVDNPYNMGLGVEKNPWCMGYVGVKATTKPNIPFSPFGTVTLTAKAFAKPFGGRVGPWFYKKWPRGNESVGSSKSEQTDQLLPKRVKDPGSISNINERYVNYSRFIGDKTGLASRLVMSRSAKAIYSLDPEWSSENYNPPTVKTSITDVSGVVNDGKSPSFFNWDHIPFNFSGTSGNGDILAWGGNSQTPMRYLELAAVLPDPFDLAYYSIEPDFYNNYLVKIKDGLLKKKGGLNGRGTLRGDIGSRTGVNELEKFGIKDQVKAVKSVMNGYPVKPLEIQEKLQYLSLDWKHALTGWSEKDLTNYELNLERFGKCLYPTDIDSKETLDPPTSGNCVGGGTTGYSVKLISSDYLKKQDLQLGGEGVGGGPLLNPPPTDGW